MLPQVFRRVPHFHWAEERLAQHLRNAAIRSRAQATVEQSAVQRQEAAVAPAQAEPCAERKSQPHRTG